MVNQEGIRAFSNGGINQGQTGRHATDHLVNLGFALNLQTVRPIIFEQLHRQQLLKVML